MMDGMPVVRYADAIMKMGYEEARQAAPTREVGNVSEGRVEVVFGEEVGNALRRDATLAGMEAKACDAFLTMINGQDINVRQYRAFGAKSIKGWRFSPDAFVQMAVQLASYRLFGRCVGTYEASQVRPFRHGRTETTRGCSKESAEWCREMGGRRDGGEKVASTRGRRVEMLRRAAKRHVDYTRMASAGLGVDRHMFGLQVRMRLLLLRADPFLMSSSIPSSILAPLVAYRCSWATARPAPHSFRTPRTSGRRLGGSARAI